MALGITFFLGLFFIFGIFIIKLSHNEELIEHWSIAMAFGAMIVLALFDLMPEILEATEENMSWITAFVAICAGFALLKLLDIFIPEHNHSDHDETNGNRVHIGMMSAIAIILHNIVEGMTVYSIASASASTGFSLAVGVGLHNIPMGMLIYSTLKHEKSAKKYTVLFLSIFSTFAGGCLMFSISSLLTESLMGILTCLTLGMVIFIVAMELLPSVRHDVRRKHAVIGTVIGALIVAISILLG